MAQQCVLPWRFNHWNSILGHQLRGLCRLVGDGKAYCWGYGLYGQIGDNAFINRLVPVAVDTSGVLSGKTVIGISATDQHTCVIALGNPAYCWGLGDYGRLGNNTQTTTSVPVQAITPF